MAALSAIFVGRSRELEELCAAVDEAHTGRGRLFLLSGDPGIGKTTLADQVAAYARCRDVEVLWGRCDETGGAPSYWPWIQSIRAYADDRDAAELESVMASGAAAIAQIIPRVGERLAHLRPPPPLAPEEGRFRLFDSITTFLKNAAKRRTLLLVLDDLHAADKPSLLLLRFVARELAATGVLILGTYRDGEVHRDHPLFTALGDLARERITGRLALSGLTHADVARCIELIGGRPPPDRVVDTVFHATDGNAFFVAEVVRWLASEGRLGADHVPGDGRSVIPPTVRAVLALRFDRLSAQCRAVLTQAAVIGREFAVQVLQRVAGLPGERIVALLDEAVAARLVAEVSGSLAQYSFSHSLIQEALYLEIPSDRRLAFHRRVAETLETIYAARLEPHVAQLARHFFAAAPAGDAPRAIHYATRAADRAAALMAHEEAVRHYEMALAALELAGGDDAGRRCELLLRLAETLWRSGEVERAKAVSLEAVELARSESDPHQLARGALALAGRLPAFGAVLCDEQVVEVLEGALLALGEEDSALRCQVLARLGEELMFSDAHDRMRSVSQQAVEMARRGGNPQVLGSVLKSTHFALWVPEEIESRLSVGSEIVQLAGRIGDRTLAFEGHLFRLISLLELGSIEAAREEVHTCERLARDLRQPYYDWLIATTHTLLAVVEGRLGDVAQLADQAFRHGEEAQHVGATLFLGVQRCHLQWLQGRFEGVIPALVGFAGTYPIMARSLSCAVAAEYGEEGREAEARAAFERIAVDDFAGVPRTLTWVSNMALLAEVCAFLHDVPRAEQLYRHLAPFAERNVVLSLSIALGSASHFLGRLAATMGRRADARRHFEDALRASASWGTVHWCARTQLAYAEMLLDCGHRDDRELVETLLHASATTAQRLELATLADRVLAAQRRSQATWANQPHAPAANHAGHAVIGDAARGSAHAGGNDDRRDGAGGRSRQEHRSAVFRREGEYWTVVYDEKVCRFRHARGFQYLARLLRNPGREFLAADLLASVDTHSPPWPSTAASATTDTDRLTNGIPGIGPLLDATAMAQYKRRLSELQAELEEAEQFNDLGRAAKARAERDAVLAQFKAATGLGERPRHTGSSAERARLTVTKGIKAALRKLDGDHPALGRYLSAHVKTGYFCVYRPDPDRPVRWEP